MGSILRAILIYRKDVRVNPAHPIPTEPEPGLPGTTHSLRPSENSHVTTAPKPFPYHEISPGLTFPVCLPARVDGRKKGACLYCV